MSKTVRILCIGDAVGALGRTIFQKHVPALREQYRIDGVLVNGENAADGRGITPRMVRAFRHNGADIITSGNHIWGKKDIYEYLTQNTDLLRPANFPSSCPGTGVATFTAGNVTVGVINLQGRIFMREHVDCPFRTAESALTFLKSKTDVIIVDFHAETTSEKMGIAHFLDGKVSAVFGTHTHVQTADERVLPGGTAFMTDLGMCGALNGMIGMKKEAVLSHMITQMPHRFEVQTVGPAVLSGMYVEIEVETGKAVAIERVRIVDDQIAAE